MFLRLSAIFLVIVATTLLLFAEGTRTWEQSRYDEFLKGTPHGVAISSDGFLELAPSFKLVASTPSSAVWDVAAGPNGEIYAATGAPARVYRITSGAVPVAIFQPQELQVQALVVDKNGTIYAATNPDGKIYKIEHSSSTHNADSTDWKSYVFFDPGTKYIWALALDASGNLFVATGDHGQIFRVAPNGDHSLFFKSDEPHIRTLAFDGQGNLIAGSDGSGLVYRISPKGEGFVLYSAPKPEITSLAVDSAGNIYLAAAGEKRPTGNAGTVTVIVPKDQNGAPGAQGAAAPQPESTVAITSSGNGVPGGSEIYKLAPDGSPERLWTSHDDLAYALAFDSHGHLLAGTGNDGEIYEIRGRDNYIELLKAGANQVTAFAKAPNGGLYASTSNLGKIFLLGSGPDSDGSYESDVFDAHIFSRWGRAEFRGQGNVELFARSGNVDNPDRNWSAWKKVDLAGDSELDVPPARFAQWKAVLHPANTAPRVDSVILNYLPKNVAPEVDDISVSVGTRYVATPRPPNLDPGQRFDPQPIAQHDRDSVGVKWNAHDDNDDQMVYSVYYRGDSQSRWLLLKDNVSEKFYSFDASLLPDGGYTIKIAASDAPSHSPQEALSSDKESDRFEVDTTPPQILDLKATVTKDRKLHIHFRASDGFSPIKRAEFSVDAGEWQFVEPVGQISDSKTETYDFETQVPGGWPPLTEQQAVEIAKGADAMTEEHVVVVRAYDRYENMSSGKVLIQRLQPVVY